MIPDYNTIENAQQDLVASGIVFALQNLFLFWNSTWVIADLKVELSHGGAWDPWLTMGVVFYLLMLVEVVFYTYKLYSLKVQDPLRS